MTERRCIFTVTTGRSGTGFLAYLLSELRHTISRHEPSPAYDECMRRVQSDPQWATDFLLSRKLPAIREAWAAAPIYVETTHVFCKGFLEPWLALPDVPVPDVILLDRPAREVALSMLRLMSIPGRTKAGLRWYLSPADPSCLTALPDWEQLHDYQLCYWYCLEMEHRKQHYAELVATFGGRSVRTSIEELKTDRGFRRLRRALDLPGLSPIGWVRATLKRRRTVNSRPDEKVRLTYGQCELQAFEEEVECRLKRRLKPSTTEQCTT